MKRIYLLMVMLVALAINANAQRTVNLDIVARLDSNNYSNNQFVPLNAGAKFLVDQTGRETHKIVYLIKNLGPDTMAFSDTVYVDPFISAYRYGIYGASKNGRGLKAGDTFAIALPAIRFKDTVKTGSSTTTLNWCDSVILRPAASNPATDPSSPSNNNLDCISVSWTTWALDVSNINIIDQTLTVYPNPAQDKLNFNFDFAVSSNSSVIIRDIQGRVVYNKNLGALNGKQNITIDASNFSNGLYFVELNANNLKKTAKVTIQK